MSLYPQTPKPAPDGYTIAPIWKTIVSEMDAGNEQRKQKSTYAKYDVSLKYRPLLLSSEIQLFWTFYMARRGAYEAFYFYDLDSMIHTNLFVGNGDGSTTIFDIPGITTSLQSIYIDGYIQGSGYSILTGGGAENSDRVQFTSAPADGAVVTCSFTGYLRIRCRFKEDKLTKEAFVRRLYKIGIELKGIAPYDL